ncbi:MAG: hypothetical protein ACP5O4_04420 [bacterium]
MDINNINNFKIPDNKIPKINPNFPKSIDINNELPVINDNIDTNLNSNQLKSNQLTNELADDQIGNKFSSNVTKENKNLINNEIPKNLTIFELDNINDSPSNKKLKFNKIKAFGPTNLPTDINEIFINPKYL